MIEGCKSKPLKINLKNLFLTGNPDCYPVTASKAYELIDKFEEDEVAAKSNPNTDKDRRPRYRKNKESRDDGNVAGAHVHENGNDATKAFVLAAVTDNGIDHQNAFKAIETKEEFEDEDMGEVACIIIGDHYYPSEDDSLKTSRQLTTNQWLDYSHDLVFMTTQRVSLKPMKTR
jgi:hypothetical protein